MASCKSNGKSEQDKFTIVVKTALLRESMTIEELRRKLKLSRQAVSRAINHPSTLPTVVRRIKKELALV